MKKNDDPVIVEQTFHASIDAVWKAITEIDQMRRWFFDNIPSFKPEVGFETQYNVRSEDRNFLHLWKVTEVVPGRKVVYNWKFADHPGDSFVEFELLEQEDATLLRLTARVTESFPDDIPEFRRENCIAGWEYFIQQSLKSFLDGR